MRQSQTSEKLAFLAGLLQNPSITVREVFWKTTERVHPLQCSMVTSSQMPAFMDPSKYSCQVCTKEHAILSKNYAMYREASFTTSLKSNDSSRAIPLFNIPWRDCTIT